MALPLPAHAHPSYNDKNCSHLAIPSCSDATVGRGMPGVNGICNTKMSQVPQGFELLLRQGGPADNFCNFARKGTAHARG
jgi:hypothetical protein